MRRDAGVSHLIYSSVLHAIASKLIQHKIKRDVEEYLIESGLNFTILHPTDYMLPIQFRSAFESGVWEQVFDLDRRHAMVDLGDVSDVVVKVAREHAHHFGATYELTASGIHTGRGISVAMTAITARPIEAKLVSPDPWLERYYGTGAAERFKHEYAVIRAAALWSSQYDFVGSSNVLDWLLARPSTTLETFIAREWASYQAETKAISAV